MVCVVGRMRDLILQLSKSSIYSTKPFDGSDTMTESYSATTGTQLKYTTGYVKVNSATPVTEGPVKGVATFTIDYTI
ncbi:hypothetical protein QY003_26105, partial [Klebsiella pneumoniae]|nr:hypothetical protein [Klebsiella pneumoniae]